MTFRTTACCAALLVCLVAPAAEAATCDGAPCPPARPSKTSKPLQLGQFMRTAAKPSTRAVKPATHVAKPVTHAVKASPGKILGKQHRVLVLRKRIAPPAEAETPLPTEAAAAFASQHDPDVRVVTADELNDIDLAAGPAAPETNGAAPSDAVALRFADATNFTVADRPGDERASPARASDPTDAATPDDRLGPSWIEWFWAMLQRPFVALTAGWRALFG